jgi:hypothetical protein
MNDPTVWAVLAAAAFAAGAMNSIAGGGTLLTFPALMAVLTPLYAGTAGAVANATSTVALLPGSLAGTWGYRKEFAAAREFAARLLPPSLVGGVFGAVLLAAFPQKFDALVPWLILTAAMLFLLQQPLGRCLARRRERSVGWAGAPPAAVLDLAPLRRVRRRQVAVLVGFQFLVAVYGGYFGAGIGILMLTALGLMGLQNIHQANAVKTLLASAINGVSVVIFVYYRLVEWRYAGVMAVAAIAGGYAGARVARRLPAVYARWAVIAIGFGLAGYYAWRQLN